MYRCPITQLEWCKKDIGRLKKQADFDQLFYDVAGTMYPEECYSKTHPVTRKQDIRTRVELFKYLTGQGYLVGTEEGMGWCVPYVNYVEGIGNIGKASVPGIGVGANRFKTTPLYEGVNLSEQYRIPLFQLVYHDSVYSTFRWNFTPDRYENSNLWTKHDLFVILYGYIPIFAEDIGTLRARGAALKQSLDAVLPWHAKIGMDELVDHERLSSDNMIQVGKYNSGNAIVVNFSHEKPAKLSNGKTVKPCSFYTYDWKKQGELSVTSSDRSH